MLPEVDEHANRTRERLSVEVAEASDETATLQGLDHLVHRRSGDPKVVLNVAFRRREPESREILHDELEILALAWRWIAGPAWPGHGLVKRNREPRRPWTDR